MIRPHRFEDLTTSVVAVGGVVGGILREHRGHAALEALEVAAAARLGDGAALQTPRALIFLYAIGLVEYDERTDTVHLLSTTEGDRK